jgi:hypothetical protein
MPTASDGKKFPYTPDGIKAHSRYEAKLKRNNKTMGNKKDVNDSDRTESPYNKLNSRNAPNT